LSPFIWIFFSIVVSKKKPLQNKDRHTVPANFYYNGTVRGVTRQKISYWPNIIQCRIPDRDSDIRAIASIKRIRSIQGQLEYFLEINFYNGKIILREDIAQFSQPLIPG
jgi:hypothetical protein